MQPEATLALEGQTIADKFLIESLLGQGAMGAVYRARWLALDKIVALKVMHPRFAKDEALTARFHREAKAASRLDHPNSVRVLDFGHEPDGRLYLAMEFLAGRDLLAVMREDRPLSPERIVGILIQTLSALAVAHELGILHRDLKPENMMILAGTDDEGNAADVVKVCDFGIAKIMSDRSDTHPSLAKGPLTTNSTLIGTPEYMSPEQGRGDKLDARSDLYSVGVILYQMLTGSLPFTGENAIGVILKHITDEPPPFASIAPDVDPRLQSICLKAMSKRREDRYPSARDMRNDLRSMLGNPGGTSPSPLAAEPSSSPVGAAPPSSDLDVNRAATATGLAISSAPRPRRAWLAGIAVASMLIGIGATVFLTQRERDRPSAVAASPVPIGPSAVVRAPAPVSPVPTAPPVAHVASPADSVSASAPSAISPPTAPSASSTAAAVPPPPAARPHDAPAAAHAAGEPPYDPTEATVEIDSMAPDGVNGDAVRTALDGAGLTTCYRDTLRAHGRRAPGTATLNLSIDATGKVWGAILNGADWLPDLAQCVQAGAMGMHIEGGSVDQGGGTAAVALSFRAP